MPEHIQDLATVTRQGDVNLSLAEQIAALRRRVDLLETIESSAAETGSWTPTDASGASLIITIGSAAYVKIGRLVVAMFSLTYPANASGVAMKVGGLPYTSEDIGTNSWPAPLSLHQFAAPLTGLVDNNATTMRFANGSGAPITNAAYSGLQIRGAAVYRTA